ncbi:hypothetical protein ACP8HZ_08615 [Francisella noatunensis]
MTSIYDNDEVIHLKNLWEDESAYKKQYKSLIKSFIKNYEQFEEDDFAVKYKKFEPSI